MCSPIYTDHRENHCPDKYWDIPDISCGIFRRYKFKWLKLVVIMCFVGGGKSKMDYCAYEQICCVLLETHCKGPYQQFSSSRLLYITAPCFRNLNVFFLLLQDSTVFLQLCESENHLYWLLNFGDICLFYNIMGLNGTWPPNPKNIHDVI